MANEENEISKETDDDEPHSEHLPPPAGVSRSTASGGDKQSSKQSVTQSLLKTGNFIYIIIPPDGGYGWIALGVVFLNLTITEGIVWTIGLMLPAIAADLPLSATDVAFIASTQMALLGSALINKFGYRSVAFGGASFASLGLLCGSFSGSQTSLIICYGLIGGVSMGIVLVSSVLIVHSYFESLRPIASAISSTGSGVGLIAISLLNASLNASMGWRYTSRIHALLLVVVTLLTCAYVEVEPTEVEGRKFIPEDDSEESMTSIVITKEVYSLYSLSKADTATSTATSAPQGTTLSIAGRFSESQRRRSLCSCCPCRAAIDRRNVINRDAFSRQDIFYSGPPDYTRSANLQLEADEEMAQRIGYSLSVMSEPRPVKTDARDWLPPKLKVAVFSLLDTKLMQLTEFKLILLCALVFAMGVNIPFVYIMCRAKIPRHLVNLLPSVIGVVNVTFRLLLGVCAYKTSIHMAYLSGLGLCVGGGAILVSAFLGQDSVALQFAFAMLFAVGVASYGALRVVIYVKVLGLEKLTNAFGLTTTIMGIGSFVGTYLAGAMLDWFLSYKPVFVFSGVCIIASGMVLLVIPRYMAYSLAMKQRRTQKRVRFTGTKWKWNDCWSMIF